MEYVKLGFGLAIAILAVLANKNIVKTMIVSVTNPILKILCEHTELLGTLQIDHEFNNSNSVHFKKIGNIFDTAISVLREKDGKAENVKLYPAAEYLIEFRRLFEEITRRVITDGIDNIGDEAFKTIAGLKMMECKNKMEKLFEYDFTEKYFVKYMGERECYIQLVCDISKDWINSHDDRYKNISLVFIQDQVNGFVRFYFDNREHKGD